MCIFAMCCFACDNKATGRKGKKRDKDKDGVTATEKSSQEKREGRGQWIGQRPEQKKRDGMKSNEKKEINAPPQTYNLYCLVFHSNLEQ